MGYRSEVFLGVKKGLETKLDKVLVKHNLLKDVTSSSFAFTKEEKNFRYKNFDNKTNQASDWLDDEWFIYSAGWLKWYSGYADVDAITDVIHNLNTNEDEDRAFIVALGEDGTIHSETGSWYDYIDHVSELKIAGL